MSQGFLLSVGTGNGHAGPARRSLLVVLLVGANLGSAGNLVETPWEIFTLFSCIKSSTQLKNLKSDIWSPYTGLSGLNRAFFLHCNSVSGNTAWGQRPGWAERFNWASCWHQSVPSHFTRMSPREMRVPTSISPQKTRKTRGCK